MNKVISVFVLTLLVGCGNNSATFDMVVMPRDSGKSYTGWLYGAGDGTGNAEVAIDGITYSGVLIRSSVNETTTVTSDYIPGTYAPRIPVARTVTDAGGNVGIRGLLHSKEGKGLRCDFQGRSHGGFGLCVDDVNKAYDVILTKRQ